MIFFLLLIVQFRNGAYLFKPDHNRDPVSVIDPIDHLKEVVVISGHVFSEISLIYEAGNFVKYRLGNIDNFFSNFFASNYIFKELHLQIQGLLSIPCVFIMFNKTVPCLKAFTLKIISTLVIKTISKIWICL